MKLSLKLATLALAVGAMSTVSSAAINVTVDSSANWIGYMNVFNLPADGGAYIFGSSWGTSDLDAGYVGNNAFVTPNTNIARGVALTDTFWWKPDGSPNKQMDANFFVESTTMPVGETLNFTGNVLSNSLVAPYTSVAFIKELDPNNNYAIVNMTTAALTPGNFSISQPITLGLLVQYGFETIGPQSTIADPALSQATYGLAVIAPSAVPEPSAAAFLGLLALPALRRRRA